MESHRAPALRVRDPLLVALLLLVTSPPAASQERDSFTLFGRVLDGRTGAAVPFARVRIAEVERIALADSLGHFHFRELPAGTYTFETQRIGYRDNREESTVSEGNVLFVGLEPMAVELDGLEVVAPREELKESLDERLDALGSPGRVTVEEELVQSTAPSVTELVNRGSQQYLWPCPNRSQDLCLLVRGRLRNFDVYVDDLLQAGGGSVLGLYDPNDLYRVEVLGELGQIRIYTRHYAMWMTRTGEDPPPICIVCG